MELFRINFIVKILVVFITIINFTNADQKMVDDCIEKLKRHGFTDDKGNANYSKALGDLSNYLYENSITLDKNLTDKEIVQFKNNLVIYDNNDANEYAKETRNKIFKGESNDRPIAFNNEMRRMQLIYNKNCIKKPTKWCKKKYLNVVPPSLPDATEINQNEECESLQESSETRSPQDTSEINKDLEKFIKLNFRMEETSLGKEKTSSHCEGESSSQNEGINNK